MDQPNLKVDSVRDLLNPQGSTKHYYDPAFPLADYKGLPDNAVDINDCILDPSKVDENAVEYFFNIGGAEAIPRGELIGVKGRAKMGKSQLVYYTIATVLAAAHAGEDITAMECRRPLKMLLVDTEQSDRSIKRCLRRAYATAGLDINYKSPYLITLYLRPLDPAQRKRAIENAIKSYSPDLVFIDGIRDLLANFNDLTESSNMIQWLMRLIAKHRCSAVCVLHQNKGKGDSNMRGHLGTELLNKLYTCFEVAKDAEGHFIINCTDSRDSQLPTFSFAIENGAYVTVAQEKEPERKVAPGADKKTQHLVNQLLRINSSLEPITRADLAARWSSNYKIHWTSAYRRIEKLINADFITMDGDKLTFDRLRKVYIKEPSAE